MMKRILPVLLCFFLFSCSKGRAITADQYARFAAKKAVIREYCAVKQDSLAAYIAGLYKSEGVTPEQVDKFIAKTDKDPESWIEIQQKIVAETEKLNPARLNQPPKKP
jgi:hypothetical protein